MEPHELKGIAVLQSIDDAALDRLAHALEVRDYADGQSVFGEGDPGDSMYFLREGRVRIEMRTDSTGDARKTLTVLEAGDYFGEMSLFDQKPRSASAVAEGAIRTLRLSKAAFDELQARGGRAGMSVLFAMIRTSSERIRRLSAHLVVYDEIGKAIGECRGLDELLAVILRQLSRAMLADWGLLVLRSQFSNRLELRGTVNLDLTPAQQLAVADGQGFLETAFKEPQARLFADVRRETFAAGERCLGFETASLVWAPIALEQELLGVIALGGLHAGQFDLDAVNLAQGVARQTAQAILNARHREEEQARSRHARQFVRF